MLTLGAPLGGQTAHPEQTLVLATLRLRGPSAAYLGAKQQKTPRHGMSGVLSCQAWEAVLIELGWRLPRACDRLRLSQWLGQEILREPEQRDPFGHHFSQVSVTCSVGTLSGRSTARLSQFSRQ